jgi:hypothetical protein
MTIRQKINRDLWHKEELSLGSGGRRYTKVLLVSQGVISRNYDDSQYDGLILDFD